MSRDPPGKPGCGNVHCRLVPLPQGQRMPSPAETRTLLDIELIPPVDLDRATTVFHRDGFVAIADALSPGQLDFAQEGTRPPPERKRQLLSEDY